MAERVKYQTITDFINHPFDPTGMKTSPEVVKKKQEFDRKYESAKEGIFFITSTEFEGSYFLHLKIPSGSKASVQYDVVIQFFTPDKGVAEQDSLRPYLLQFFSNSPSFIFQYAALYYREGYLIDAFQKKLDSRITDPTYVSSGTAKKELMFDKSLYFACKYVLENGVSLLQKSRLKRLKRASIQELLRSISGENPGNSGNVVQDLKVEMQKDKAKATRFIKDIAKLRGGVVSGKPKVGGTGVHKKKSAVTSTLKEPRQIVKPKVGRRASTAKRK